MSSDGSPNRPVSRIATIATSSTVAPARRIRSNSVTSTRGPLLPRQVPRDENPDASHSIRVSGLLPPQKGWLAVAEGFEPSDGGCPSRAFEARSFGRSDTPPPERLSRSVPDEEIAQPRARFIGHHTAHHLGPMVQPTVPYDVPQRADGTGLLVVRREDQAVQPGQHDRARAHGAGLQSDDERAAGQPPFTDVPGGVPDRKDLGVRGRIAGRLPLV